MAFNPYQQISVGQSDSTQINAPISGLNNVLTGFGQSATAAASATLTLTTSPVDVANCSITAVVAGANAFAIVIATFDFGNDVLVAGQTTIGTLVVNGSTQSAEVHLALLANARSTVGQSYTVPLSPGSNVLKLQARKTAAGSVAGANATHTTITVILFDVP